MQITPTLGPGQAPGTTQPTLPVDANEIRRRQRLAEALMSQGMQTERIRHPLEAVGHVMQTGVGALWGDSARKAGTEREAFEMAQAQAAKNQDMAQAQARHQALAEALQGQGGQAEQIRQLLSDPATAPVGSQLAVKYLSKGPDKGTAMMQNFRMAQENPAFGQFLESRKPTTNINLKGESKFQEKRGEAIAGSITGLETKSDAARDLAQGYSQIGTLLGDKYVYTGTAADPISWVKKTGKTLLGVDIKGVKEAEVAEKVRKGLLGKIREMAGDQRMTDADRKFYMETMPALSDSAEGVALSVELMRQLADATMKKEAKAAEFIQSAPTAQEGWRAFRQWERGQPIWNPELIQRARGVAAKAKQNAPTVGTPLHRATNPETGERLIWRDGQWQPE